MTRILWLKILVLPLLAVVIVSPVFRAQAPPQDYLVYVVCESADKLVRLRFTPGPSGAAAAKIDHEAKVGLMPTDINGPHGIAISPDRQFIYVSVGHGLPYGSVWKYKAGSDEMVRFTSLGLFPATTDITHDGKFIYVANANFHADGHAFGELGDVDFGGRDGPDDRSQADHDVHDAARVAPESARNEALFGLHDGRHARRD